MTIIRDAFIKSPVSLSLSSPWLYQRRSYLTLAGIIHARSVCKRWREIVLLADIPLYRAELYHLYLDCISSEIFQESHSSYFDQLVPFDRAAYVDNLTRQHPRIPEDFACWVLEWPSKAVFDGIWPGLHYDESPISEADIHHRSPPGANELGRGRPTIDTVANYELQDGGNGLIRGLKVIDLSGYQTWLIIDAPQEELRGSVIEFLEGVMYIQDGCIKDAYVASSWMEWQGLQLKRLNDSGRSAKRRRLGR